MSIETVQATEKIARRISSEQTGSEALWEMFLTQAYDEYFELGKER